MILVNEYQTQEATTSTPEPQECPDSAAEVKFQSTEVALTMWTD